MIENAEEEDQAVVRPRQPELGVEIDLVDFDLRLERFFEQAGAAQGIEIGRPIIKDVHLVPQLLEQERKRPIGGADIRDRLPLCQTEEIAARTREHLVQVDEVGECIVWVPGEIACRGLGFYSRELLRPGIGVSLQLRDVHRVSSVARYAPQRPSSVVCCSAPRSTGNAASANLSVLMDWFLRGMGRLAVGARFGVTTLRNEGLLGLRRELLRRTRRGRAFSYHRWVASYDAFGDEDRRELAARLPFLRSRPLFSVLMPVYETDEQWLRRAVESVREQIYPDWELCVADDSSKSPYVKQVLDELATQDERIRIVYRPANGHISAASNSALELARGDFIVLLDHDDELPPHALFRLAEELDAHPDAAIIYSDEDKIDERGRRFDPYFKPDWNPDLMNSQN